MIRYKREDLIKQLAIHEGVELEVYEDTLGIETIGIGRNLKDRGIADLELAHLSKSMDEIYQDGITEEDAYFLAERDIDIVEGELFAAKPICNRLDGVRQMILIDMAFNMGIPRLMKFKKMWANIEGNNYELAAIEMLDSLWADQVKGRATKLSEAMKTGII